MGMLRAPMRHTMHQKIQDPTERCLMPKLTRLTCLCRRPGGASTQARCTAQRATLGTPPGSLPWCCTAGTSTSNPCAAWPPSSWSQSTSSPCWTSRLPALVRLQCVAPRLRCSGMSKAPLMLLPPSETAACFRVLLLVCRAACLESMQLLRGGCSRLRVNAGRQS